MKLFEFKYIAYLKKRKFRLLKFRKKNEEVYLDKEEIKKFYNFYKLFIIFFIIFFFFIPKNIKPKQKDNISTSKDNIPALKNLKLNNNRIGVISFYNDINVGNILVKYSMAKKLKEFGFNPTIICRTNTFRNINFLNKIVIHQ